jgi:hypothetical protein
MGGFSLANLSGGPMMPTRFGGGDPVGGPVPRVTGFQGPDMRPPMPVAPPQGIPPSWTGQPPVAVDGPMMPPRFGGDPVGGPVMRQPGFGGGPMWPQPSPWGGFGGGGGFGQANPMMMLHQLNGLGMGSMY